MNASKQEEQRGNENYAKNFTRVPNILFESYRYLTKEEVLLYIRLRFIFWDTKPRYLSLRELADMTGYSSGALSKMLPRLTIVGLIHAEIRRRKSKEGKEKGNPVYHVTINDIWEENRRFYAEERFDPSEALLVHQMNEACSPNEQAVPKLVHQMNELVHENVQACSADEQDRGQNEAHKITYKTDLQDNTYASSAHAPDAVSIFDEHTSAFVENEDEIPTINAPAVRVVQASEPAANETISQHQGEHDANRIGGNYRLTDQPDPHPTHDDGADRRVAAAHTRQDEIATQHTPAPAVPPTAAHSPIDGATPPAATEPPPASGDQPKLDAAMNGRPAAPPKKPKGVPLADLPAAAQARIRHWYEDITAACGGALLDGGPVIAERVAVRWLCEHYTDQQIAALLDYLRSRHRRWSHLENKPKIRAAVVKAEAQAVAKILHDERVAKEQGHVILPPNPRVVAAPEGWNPYAAMEVMA